MPGDVGVRSVGAAAGRLAAHEVGDRRDRERRCLRARGDLAVLEVRVAELFERGVAHREEAAGQSLLARDGEVPGQVEALGRDLRLLQRAQDRDIVLGAGALRALGDQLAERGVRLERCSARALEVAQDDDVAMALGPVLGRVDVERGVGRRRRVGVDLRPDRPADRLLAADVEDDDRRVLLRVGAEVLERDRTGPLKREARDVGHDLGAGAEAVVAGEGGHADRLALLVLRHVRGRQVETQTGRHPLVGLRELVVRPRQQTGPRVDRVALGGTCGRCCHEGDGSGHGDYHQRKTTAHCSPPGHLWTWAPA